MKKIILSLAFCLLAAVALFSQTLVTSVEAESGVLGGGAYVAAATSNSSGPFVTGFINSGDQVTVTVTVPTAGNYKLSIRYRSIYGAKVQDVYANNVFVAGVNFPQTTNFVDLDAGSAVLNAGNNTLTLKKNWGYMDVDKFSIYTVLPNVFNISPSLIDVQATTNVKDLYNFMVSQFGRRIITGQTDDYYDQLKTIAGKSPLLRAWDMASYSPMYAYNWNNGFAFGAVDNHDAERAIGWYNSTGKTGIVSFHWHWHSPSGGTPGVNTFYTTNTSFDVSQAVIPGTTQNTEVLRDIDAIAVPLKKLRDAGVPILWRPLHEAGGAWFWWGAKGAAPAKALWDIMYNRLTNFHGLHNLIWIWSTPEAGWYPGNAKVDMLGYDSYPGNYNYTPQKNVFDNLYTITAGQKLLAMSENGPIPDIQNSIDGGAPWSYFMSWNDLVASQNSSQHIVDVFANANVITLENYAQVVLPVTLTAYSTRLEGKRVTIEWATSQEQNNDHFDVERSVDGTHFYKVAAIKGQGNSSTPHSYIQYDYNPVNGTNYYRLVQYNFDGRATYFGVKIVGVSNAGAAPNVVAYPNPANGNPGILLSNYAGKNITITITDMAGRSIQPQTVATLSGNGYYKLNIPGKLAAGMYQLHVSGINLTQSLKVIIQ